jgi:transposase
MEEEIFVKKKRVMTEAQREALENNKRMWNEKRKTGEIVQRRERTTKKQLANQMKQVKKVQKRRSISAEMTEKKVVKAFLESESVTEAAKKAEVSINHASRVLLAVEKSGSLAEAMFKAGLTFERQAELHKEFIEYNKEKVVRVTGEGMSAREVEEMRDGRLAFTATQHAAKFTAVSADVLANKADASNIDSNTAMLAIKSLIQKLDEDNLRLVRDSIDVLLEKNLKVVKS